MIEEHEQVGVTSTEKAYFVGSGAFQLPLVKFSVELWIRPPSQQLLRLTRLSPSGAKNPNAKLSFCAFIWQSIHPSSSLLAEGAAVLLNTSSPFNPSLLLALFCWAAQPDAR